MNVRKALNVIMIFFLEDHEDPVWRLNNSDIVVGANHVCAALPEIPSSTTLSDCTLSFLFCNFDVAGLVMSQLAVISMPLLLRRKSPSSKAALNIS